MSFTLRFENRTLTKAVYFPGIYYQVDRLQWDIYGGPSKAEVTVYGPVDRLWGVVALLRCGVTVLDESGGPCWWGYVHEVDASPLVGGVSIYASMDEVYTSTAARYRDERPSDSVNVGWQFQTAWQSDAYAIAEWGTRQGVWTMPVTTATEATALATTALANKKRPILGAKRSTAKVSCVKLKLRGWWDTLGWKYFTEVRGMDGQATGGGGVQNIGFSAAGTAAAESFSPSGATWSASSAFIKVGKFGNPLDNICVDIRTDNAGAPSATVVLTKQIAGTTLTGDSTWVKFDFGSAASLTYGSIYWLMVWRSGAVDAANYYRLMVDESVPYYSGTLSLWNGAAWGGRTPNADLVFTVMGLAQTTDQIITMADPAKGGQFLKGVYVKDASGVNGRLYRSGRDKALDEIKALLDVGCLDGSRLMAVVNAERYLVVRKVASLTNASYLVNLDGEIRDMDGSALAVSAAAGVIGRWARVLGMDQVGGDNEAPRGVLITRAEWSAGKFRVNWE